MTAVLFDIDGTLVDSNFLHVEAWGHALLEVGRPVPAWRVQHAIGADSNELLKMLLGDATQDLQDRAKSLKTDFYEKLQPRARVLPGARELVTEIADRGLRVVLATSAPQKELDGLLRTLDLDDYLYAVTSAEDVEKAKPEPDIITHALAKAEASASDAVMIGDSVWDIRAATKAGVKTIGLLSGGTGRETLLSEGAIAVYDDPADLRNHLDDEPIRRYFTKPTDRQNGGKTVSAAKEFG